MTKKKLFGVLFGGFFVLLIAGVWLFFCPTSPVNRRSAIRTAREWARLAAFPESDGRIDVEIGGSAFSREFIIEFTGSADDIADWIKASPGTKDVIPVTNADGSVLYKIQPSGGAQFAEVILYDNGKSVRIRTFWS
ncbi:MAG: hypothetical protein FVQ82_17120 [Planctomycetes bacterium]|nr:hypothetical protein [Planctomycetota bacterium]